LYVLQVQQHHKPHQQQQHLFKDISWQPLPHVHHVLQLHYHQELLEQHQLLLVQEEQVELQEQHFNQDILVLLVMYHLLLLEQL